MCYLVPQNARNITVTELVYFMFASLNIFS